jgi:DHA3 family macrolide efflux protein-like MFS transporter
MNRLRTFYFLVATQTLSIIGSRMTGIAVGIRVFTETGDTAPLLLNAFFNELPAMLGSSFAGVLVDRWDRKRVLMLADAGQALGSLLLMLSFLSGHFQLWHLYVVALAQGTCAMFQGPAKDASTTLLVPENQRERANAIQAMSFPLAGVVAPALTGVIYVAVGIGGVILIDLLTFLIAVYAVYRTRIPNPARSEEGQSAQGTLLQEWRGGLRFLRDRPALLGLVLYFTAMNFLLNGPLELALPYTITITGSETLSGLILAANSLGGVVGTAILAFWGGTRPRIHTFMPAMLLVGVMFLAFGTARSAALLAVSIFLLLLPLQTWAIYTSVIQIKTPPDMQGRIFSIIGQLGYLGATASFLLTGPLVDSILEPRAAAPGEGMGLLLVGTGVIILVVTLIVYALPTIRRLESTLPDYDALPATD